MRDFVFKCPKTGLRVQARVAESPIAGDYFEAVECTACKALHLVNPQAGKVAGDSLTTERR
jgi:hypothetical protein